MTDWDIVIGLEVHAQLATTSKLFSGAATQFGAPANAQTAYIDAGLPGTLPVLNRKAVEMALQFGLAIGAQINPFSYFERKNYFYPDLPKGYQISQYKVPIIGQGSLSLSSGQTITILRAHLEEDAGKSFHDKQTYCTGIDLNRAGTALLEIVTTPCITSAEEAILYLKTLHQLLQFLGICDGNLQEGSFRCDVNISLKPHKETQLGTRVEIKNLNSFRFIEKAIEHEIYRQKKLLSNKQSISQETRLFNPETNTTHLLREKETAEDYRYFPDPDLLPIVISKEYLDNIRATLPPIPQKIKAQLDPMLSEEYQYFVLSSPSIYHFFSKIKEYTNVKDTLILNWLKGPYATALYAQQLNFDTTPIAAKELGILLKALEENKISRIQAKDAFNHLWKNPNQDISILIQQYKKMSASLSPEALQQLIKKILDMHPVQVMQYREGKHKLLSFFVGKVMKETKGQLDPEHINVLIKTILNQ